jgi:K+/H+ antiporter YhaU regulatory subunit KhtT
MISVVIMDILETDKDNASVSLMREETKRTFKILSKTKQPSAAFTDTTTSLKDTERFQEISALVVLTLAQSR